MANCPYINSCKLEKEDNCYTQRYLLKICHKRMEKEKVEERKTIQKIISYAESLDWDNE